MTITCRIRMWTLSSMKTNPIAAPTVAKVLGKRAICMGISRRFMKGNGPTLAICARRVLRWNNTLISTLQVDMVLKVFIILVFSFPAAVQKFIVKTVTVKKWLKKSFLQKSVCQKALVKSSHQKSFHQKIVAKKVFRKKLSKKSSSKKFSCKRVLAKKYLYV